MKNVRLTFKTKRVLLVVLTCLYVFLSPACCEPASTAAPAFPVRVSANRRHLVDANGSPFLMTGDTAWFLITNLNKTDTEIYLENRRQKGYNTILTEAIVNKTYTWKPPYNREGNAPFSTAGDFSTPNDAYFAHLDWVISKAAEKGILVILLPAYLGYGGGSDGWWDEIIANGPTKCRNYGRYLGKRYKNFTNIIWMHGGDYNPPDGSPGTANALEIIRGIKEVDPAKLHTFHGARYSTAFGQPAFGPYLDLDATYSGDLTHPESLLAYNRSNFGPHFLMEGRYEGLESWNNNKINSPSLVRAGAYWSHLSGSTGQISATMSVWTFGWDGSDWRAGMESSTSLAMGRAKAVFQNRPWQNLIPDQNHTTVTAGYGTQGKANYVTAARTGDGTLVMAYLPSTGVETRTLTVDMARLSGNATAKWFNPTNGVYTTIAGTPFTNSGKRNFTTPGNNGTGTNDWVLVLETAGTAAKTPAATTGSSTNITPNSATLNATVNPNGSSTTVYFQYGTNSGNFTSKTTSQTLSGASFVNVSAHITGLSPNTGYYYSIVASNGAGTVYGTKLTFTTSNPSATERAVEITSPKNGSTLTTGPPVNFEWSAGSNATAYWLYAGKSPGAKEYYNSGETTATQTTVSGLPRDGSRVYVRLWHKVDSKWQFGDYAYLTAPKEGAADTTPPAVTITSPATGAVYTTAASTVTLSGTAFDRAGVTAVTCANNGASCGTVSGTTSWSISSVPLVIGKNNIIVSARDAAGNIGTRTLTITRTTATASSNQWIQVPKRTKAQKAAGLSGGEGCQMIYGIAYAPSNPNIVYFVTDTSQVWKSTDSGTSWRKTKATGFRAIGGVSILIHPTNPDIIYVAGSTMLPSGQDTDPDAIRGILKSTDGGDNWTLVKSANFTRDYSRGGQHIIFAGSNMYAIATNDGILKSTDGGTTWNQLIVPSPYYSLYTASLRNIAVHPTNNAILYVSTSSGLYKVVDGGASATVTPIGSGLSSDLYQLVIDPNTPNTMYIAAGTNGVWKSTNGGSNFSKILSAPVNDKGKTGRVQHIAMSPVNSSKLIVTFAGLFGKYVYHSSNGGTNWTQTENMDHEHYLGSGWIAGSVFDYTTNISGVNDSSAPIAFHPTNENVALVNGSASNVKKTTNGGVTWKYSNTGYTGMGNGINGGYSPYGWDSTNYNRAVYTSIDFGTMVTEDNEHTFTAIMQPIYNGRNGVLSAAIRGNIIIEAVGAVTNEAGKIPVIAISRDTGKSWTYINGAFENFKHISFHPQNSNIVYAGKYKFTNIQTNNNYTNIANGRSVAAVFQGQTGTRGDTVYSHDYSKIYKSTDAGATWQDIYPGIQGGNGAILQIAVSPTNENRIYVAVHKTGLYIIDKPTASGGTATYITAIPVDQFNKRHIVTVATDPNDANVVYAGTMELRKGATNGIFRSTDGGNTWSNITNDTFGTMFFVAGIMVRPDNSYVYISSYNGTWKLPPPGVSGGSPAVDTTSPVISITSPTSASTYASSQSTLDLGGTASDNIGVTSVTWTNGKGNGGTASGTNSWAISGIPLVSGSNHISVTARDAAGNSSAKSVTVTYTTAAERAVEITSPAPDSTLTDSPVNFEWSAGANGSVYWLYAGKSKGTKEYYNSGETRATRAAVSGLPWDGGRIYVRLWHKADSKWQYNDYSYETKKPETIIRAAEITSPAPGSVLADSTVNFEWSSISHVSACWLYVGKFRGTREYYNSGETTAAKTTVSGLPRDGSSVYVRLWYKVGSKWLYRDYSYATNKTETAASTAEITSPAPGAVLAGPSVNFEWSAGSNVSVCWLYAGKSKGTREYYNSGETRAAETTVSGLPRDGSAVYVRLWYKISGTWHFKDYQYKTS